MEWKYIDGYGKTYKLYNNGDIYNINKKLKPTFFNAYNAYKITLKSINNKNPKSYTLSHLVYSVFKMPVEPNHIIKYLDGNSKNCHIDNLLMVSKSDTQRKFNNKIDLDNTQEWKPLFQYEKNYLISNKGNIYSLITNKLLNSRLSKNNYYTIMLNDRKEKFIHRLVWSTFNDRSINKDKVIDHINRIRTDNNIENLREVSISENCKNRNKIKQYRHEISRYSLNNELIDKWNNVDEICKKNKFKKNWIISCCCGIIKKAYGYIWKYTNYITDLTDFYDIKTNNNKKYSSYKINKKGQIINNNGKPMRYSSNKGYCSIQLVSDNPNKQRSTFFVHRLMGFTFLKNPDNKEQINHKDKNRQNNNIDNLEWVTPSENLTHAVGKKIVQIDIKTDKQINIFNTIAAAGKHLKKSYVTISKACAGKQKTAFGYKWKYFT